MPTVYSLLGPKRQFEDANGNPLTGGLLTFYVSGSTTPKPTYTDSTGTVLNPNPVVLNSRGEPPNDVWGTTGPYRIVLQDALLNVLWTIDGISGVNDVGSITQSEWVPSGLAPTFVSATSFTVPGDQTALLTIGRRIQTTNTGGTITSTVVSSTFGGASTTVVVTSDSGILDSGLTTLSYGLLNAAAPSVPYTGAKRLQGDFSNATQANRTYLQTLTTNGETNVGALPTGTATASAFIAYNSATAGSASTMAIGITGGEAQLLSSRTGPGTYQPLVIYTTDLERLRIAANGQITAGAAAFVGVRSVTLTNTDAGSGSAAAYIASSNAGTLTLQSNATAAGALGFIGTSSGLTGGLAIATAGANPLTVQTDSTERLRWRGDGTTWTNANAREVFLSNRAWVNFDGTLSGTIAPRASANISSVTKTGTGAYTLAFTTAHLDANYAWAGSCRANSGGGMVSVPAAGTIAAGSIQITTVRSDNSVQDFDFVTFATFR